MGEAKYAKWVKSLPPMTDKDGKPNRIYFGRQIAKLNELMLEAVHTGGRIPFNFKEAVAGLEAQYRMMGGDPKQIHDTRTDAERAIDLLERLKEMPESIFEATEQEIGSVERAMDIADAEVGLALEDEARQKRLSAAPKVEALLTLIRRVKNLRNRARLELPDRKTTGWRAHAVKAAHTLRFMCYVGRSQMHGHSVFEFARCHGKLAWDLYEARQGLRVRYDDAMDEPIVEPGPKYNYAILVMPLGHGKSEIITHVTALEIVKDYQKAQVAMLHAVSSRAEANLQYVSSCFDPSTSNGRRCLGLYPHIHVARSTAKEFDLVQDQALREPTMQAAGFMSARLGAGLSLIVCDDIVPMSDRDEPETRKRRWDRWTGQWTSRMRGKSAFCILIGTLWHEEDVLMKSIDLARLGKINCLVSIQACGGPESSPPFRPLFRPAYDESRLKRTFLANPTVYTAAFMSDPRSKHTRRIANLKFYDSRSAEHALFVRNAEHHVSIDPSFTGNEKADRAGIIHAAIGEDVVIEKTDTGETRRERKKLRIVGAWELPANQVAGMEFIAQLAQNERVDYVHIEAHGGNQASADIAEHYHGISAIRHKVGPVKKEVRLAGVAGMLENARAERGVEAVVEFPGYTDENGVVQPDPAYKWLYDQILLFGVVKADHCVDAITQLCAYVRQDLAVGSEGIVSQIVRSNARAATSLKAKYLEAMFGLEPTTMSKEEKICHWN